MGDTFNDLEERINYSVVVSINKTVEFYDSTGNHLNGYSELGNQHIVYDGPEEIIANISYNQTVNAVKG